MDQDEDNRYGVVHPEPGAAAPITSIDSVRLAAVQLATSSSIPGAVAALARLNVFEALARAVEPGHDGDARQQLTAAEIAAAVAVPGQSQPINVVYLGRLLRMMSGVKILHESVNTTADGRAERRYGLEPIAARFFVDDVENGSLVNMLLAYQMDAFLRTWQYLHESVVDDTVAPFARAHNGLSAWEYKRRTPEFNMVFNKAMEGHSKVYMRAVLDTYDRGFDGVTVLVDVGGGFGSSLGLITARYPNIRGINFDQPHVIAACPELPRVEHVSGNMFESVPNGGDAIFMKFILHDWDDESCVKILKNCYQALPAQGKVIALDNMLPEIINFEGGDSVALQFDIHMLAFNNSGARERTECDYRKLGLAAGFTHVKVVCKVDMLAVTEFHK